MNLNNFLKYETMVMCTIMNHIYMKLWYLKMLHASMWNDNVKVCTFMKVKLLMEKTCFHFLVFYKCICEWTNWHRKVWRLHSTMMCWVLSRSMCSTITAISGNVQLIKSRKKYVFRNENDTYTNRPYILWNDLIKISR